MARSLYAKLAERYWTTYLPTQVAETSDPKALFDSLGEQVEAMIAASLPAAMDAVKRENPDATFPQLRGLLRGARDAVEQDALRQIVMLPPEEGTEAKRMPGTELPGWEE